LVSPDPTNSAIHCDDPTGQNRAPILADFSSRGIPKNPMYHPDITAPGVHIVSTRASTGTVLNGLDANHDFNLTSTCAISLANEPYYTCASGTSMATPHVVGVVALMQEAAGGTLTPDQVLNAITSTARPLPDALSALCSHSWRSRRCSRHSCPRRTRHSGAATMRRRARDTSGSSPPIR